MIPEPRAAWHILRHRIHPIAVVAGAWRRLWWRYQGMSIGHGVLLGRLHVTWPHQVAIGPRSILEHDVYFHYDGIWSPGPSIIVGKHVFIGNHCEFNISDRIEVGAEAMIGSGCKFIDHAHGTAPGVAMGEQRGTRAPIIIGCGAWLGVNVIVLHGVVIGDGAVIGAGAVVTQSVAAGEIWAGVPARQIRKR